MKFKAVIVGENFLVDLDGKPQKVSFATARYLEAPGPEQAEEDAVRVLATEPGLREAVLNTPADPPLLHVHDLEPLESFDGIDDLTPPLEYAPEGAGSACGCGRPTSSCGEPGDGDAGDG